MLIHEFDELMEAKPFTPGALVKADGREVRIKSPEFSGEFAASTPATQIGLCRNRFVRDCDRDVRICPMDVCKALSAI